MRLFRHMVTEYFCAKRCGYHHSTTGANWSLFHLLAAAAAAIPLWLAALREGFPWYYLGGILAGELLLVFLAGFLSGLVLLPFTKPPGVCKECGAPMVLAGRHFDPAGSQRPHWSDIAIAIVFAALNIALWIAMAEDAL